MVIELVEKKDCVGRQVGNGRIQVGGGGSCCNHKNYKGKMLKKITNRDRKKCHKCGRDGGLWYESFVKGKREYLFLCQDCYEK